MEKIAIGSIITEEGKRYGIYWDGSTLCDDQGEEIMDGAASTLEEAQDLASTLWNMPEFDYHDAEEFPEDMPE